MRFPRWAGAGTAALGLAAGCGSSPAAPLPLHQVLSVDAGAHAVRLQALASYHGVNGEMNFDGYSYGAMTVRVPLGWTLTVRCVNESSVLSHSCALIADVGADVGTRSPVFPGASTPDPADGLAPHQQAEFTVVADRVGSYRLACVVSGHEVDGMWDRVVVSSSGSPSVSARGTGATSFG